MKLILAIVNNDDAASVAAALTTKGFTITKLSTTGGFLQAGNTTLLIGAEEADVERALGAGLRARGVQEGHPHNSQQRKRQHKQRCLRVVARAGHRPEQPASQRQPQQDRHHGAPQPVT